MTFCLSPSLSSLVHYQFGLLDGRTYRGYGYVPLRSGEGMGGEHRKENGNTATTVRVDKSGDNQMPCDNLLLFLISLIVTYNVLSTILFAIIISLHM